MKPVLKLILLGLALSASARATELEAVPGEILVGARIDGKDAFVSASFGTNVARMIGADEIASNRPLQMDPTVRKIVLKDPKQVDRAIARLREKAVENEIRFAEPNWIYAAEGWKEEGTPRFTGAEIDALASSVSKSFAADSAPNDAAFALQWDLDNRGQVDRPGAASAQSGKVGADLRVLSLWEKGITGSRGIIVAVIDSGVDYAHPQLAANIFRNPGEVPGNGIDDDGNGVVDDVHGANFQTGTGVGNGMDDNGHGTHCAGTIGAIGNDGVAISGVNWEATMLPVKFLSSQGRGTLEGSLNSIRYAIRMGARVLSNSWGGGKYSSALREAIRDAGREGAIFVAAAGNKSRDVEVLPHYPSSYRLPNVVAVAATTNRDELASFSNFGKKSVHVAAPGKFILSTLPGGRYGYYSGTSMATPHVAGVAALMLAMDPSLSPAELRSLLVSGSDRIRSLRQRSRSNGRLNAARASEGIR